MKKYKFLLHDKSQIVFHGDFISLDEFNRYVISQKTTDKLSEVVGYVNKDNTIAVWFS